MRRLYIGLMRLSEREVGRMDGEDRDRGHERSSELCSEIG